MKNISKSLSKLLLLGMLSVLAISAAFAPQLVKAQAGSVVQQQDATPTPSGDVSTQTASMVELWDQFCVRKIPYTLLALPKDATFEVVQPTEPLPTPMPGYFNADELACVSVGIFRDKQVVVCRGPQLFAFTLKVNDAGATEDFQVPLKACPLPSFSAPTATPAP